MSRLLFWGPKPLLLYRWKITTSIHWKISSDPDPESPLWTSPWKPPSFCDYQPVPIPDSSSTLETPPGSGITYKEYQCLVHKIGGSASDGTAGPKSMKSISVFFVLWVFKRPLHDMYVYTVLINVLCIERKRDYIYSIKFRKDATPLPELPPIVSLCYLSRPLRRKSF